MTRLLRSLIVLALVLLVATSTLHAAIIDNLVSYWKMDEASGNCLDAHSSNTLTENGTLASVTGIINNARTFDYNVNETCSLADNAALSTGDIDFAIQAWVHFPTATGLGVNNSSIVAKDTVTDGEYYLLHDGTAGRFKFIVFGASGFASGTTVTANNFGLIAVDTWYHVIGWHDAANNQIGIAVNAGTADTAAHSAGVLDGTGTFRIGGDSFPPADDLSGIADEVGFWKKVLSSQERTDLYNGGAGLAYGSFGGGGGGAAPCVIGGGIICRGGDWSATLRRQVWSGSLAQ